MPIVFEQPDAIGTAAGQAAAIGYGTALQGDKDRDFYLKAAALANQSRGAVNQQSAVNAQIGNSWTQAGNQQAAQGQQADQFAQQQIDQQNQRQAALQAAQQSQADQFTYQDNVRLSQLQNGLSAIQNDPNLSAEEKADATLQIQTGIDPYKRKQQAAQLKQQQAETEKVQNSAKLEATLLKTGQDFFAGNPSGVKIHDDGSKTFWDGKGLKYEAPPKPEPYNDPFGEEGGTGKSKSAGAGGGVDMAAVSKNALDASKNAEGQVDPEKYAANLQKFSKIHQDLHDSIRQQGQQTLAQEIVTDNLTSPGGMAALKGPQLKTHIKALNKLVSAPIPDDADAAQQQADAITGTYPNPATLSQQNPAAARRLKELVGKINDAKSEKEKRLANVPDSSKANTPQSAAAPQEDYAVLQAAVRRYNEQNGNKPGYFYVASRGSTTKGEPYYMNADGEVAKVTEPSILQNLGHKFTSGMEKQKEDLTRLGRWLTTPVEGL